MPPKAVVKATLSYTASLISQGNHRFYSLTMPSEVLARTCSVDARDDNPLSGFQRKLDRKRAEEIAKYIDEGFGTIPCSIVLSAQQRANFQYDRPKRTISFNDVPGAFLILDGQHRVFGFALAKTGLRVPVVVYNSLTRTEECRLFMDINTKQRPVPPELILDIKKLAETETDDEGFLREIFDKFNTTPNSPLMGLMSPAAKAKGKLSRVTFNAALKSIWPAFEGSDSEQSYRVLSAYLHACMAGLRTAGASDNIVNPTLFKALIFLFPDVAQRVADRSGDQFSPEGFNAVLKPFFMRVKKSELLKPGKSHLELHETFLKALRLQFTITR